MVMAVRFFLGGAGGKEQMWGVGRRGYAPNYCAVRCVHASIAHHSYHS